MSPEWQPIIMRKRGHTQRLDVIFVETPLDVLDHQARLPYLRISHHPDLDDDAADDEYTRFVRFEISPSESRGANLLFSSLFSSIGCEFPPEPLGVDDEDAILWQAENRREKLGKIRVKSRRGLSNLEYPLVRSTMCWVRRYAPGRY